MSVRSRRSAIPSHTPDVSEESSYEEEDEVEIKEEEFNDREDEIGSAVEEEKKEETEAKQNFQQDIHPIVEERLSAIEAGLGDLPSTFDAFSQQMSSLLSPLMFGTEIYGPPTWSNKHAAKESKKVEEYLQAKPDVIESKKGGHTAWVDKGGYNCILIQDASQLSYLPYTHLVSSHVNTNMEIPRDKAHKLHKIHQMIDYNPGDCSLWVACDSFGSCIAVLTAIKAYADGAVSTSQAKDLASNLSKGAKNGDILETMNNYIKSE
jgi:hypothetical protein